MATVVNAIGESPEIHFAPGRADGAQITLVDMGLSVHLDIYMVCVPFLNRTASLPAVVQCYRARCWDSGCHCHMAHQVQGLRSRPRPVAVDEPKIGGSIGGLSYVFDSHKHAILGCIDNKSFKPERKVDCLVLEQVRIREEGGIRSSVRRLQGVSSRVFPFFGKFSIILHADRFHSKLPGTGKKFIYTSDLTDLRPFEISKSG